MNTLNQLSPQEQMIIEIISSHFGLDKENVTPASDLVDDLNLQPLELVDLTETLNQKLDINLDTAEASQWKTILDIVHSVMENGDPIKIQANQVNE